MDHNESAKNLRELVSRLGICGKCGGIGGIPGRFHIKPCPACVNTGRAPLSDDEAEAEHRALDGLRNLVYHRGYYEFEFPDFKELEV